MIPAAFRFPSSLAAAALLAMAVRVRGDPLIPGSLDPVINYQDYFPAPCAVALQPDGKILVGGFGGIVRLNADGTRDTAWAPEFTDEPGPVIFAIAVQDDEKILIGGTFHAVNGVPRKSIARLNKDGTIDPAFDPGEGAQGDVHSIALQMDGRILIGGFGESFDGQPRNDLARLSASGVLETTAQFRDPVGSLFEMRNILPATDGSMIIAPGWVNTDIGTIIYGVAKLLPDGAVDAGFYRGTGGSAVCSVRQPDGRMLVGGGVLDWHTSSRQGVLRLTHSGAVESTESFHAGAGELSGEVTSLCLQADGKIVCAGNFTTFNGHSKAGVIRLRPDGFIEGGPAAADFSTGGYTDIRIAALQADGQILIGGSFSEIKGQARTDFARLRNTSGPESVAVTPGSITWMRGGSLPEVEWVKFDLSVNGAASWTPLGIGWRIAGGWQLGVPPLPAAGIVRCRGRVHVSGSFGMGSGLVETRRAFGPGSTLAAWKEQQFGASAASPAAADDADPDRDGYPNFAEFCLGLNPQAADRSPQTLTAQPPVVLTFEYLRSPAAAADGVSFFAEWSDTLAAGSWSSTGVTTQTVMQGALERITASIPRSAALRRCVRLRMKGPM